MAYTIVTGPALAAGATLRIVTEDLRDAVRLSATGRPPIGAWVNWVEAYDLEIASAVRQIDCAQARDGEPGELRAWLPTFQRWLTVQWCYGIVELALIS